MTKETPHVALLRGINVGGKNLLPMKALAALATSSGVQDVGTHIQSGNLLFRATPSAAERLCETLSAAIAAQHGLSVPVQIRALAEMEAIVAANPFAGLAAGEDARLLYVSFLSAAPSAAQIAGLDPHRSPLDEFAVRGDVMYLYLRNGAAKTRITNAWVDARLNCVSTMRNWAVTQKLLELLRQM